MDQGLHKSKQDKVQNIGLRTILGAMKTTQIIEVEKTTDLEPLDARREFKALVLAKKVNKLQAHPLHTKLNSLSKKKPETTKPQPYSENSSKAKMSTTIMCRDITARNMGSKKHYLYANKAISTRLREKGEQLCRSL